MKKYFFIKGFNKQTASEQQEQARQLYQELGSLKRTARQLNCSKAEAKKLLGSEWFNSQHKKNLQESAQKKQRRIKIKYDLPSKIDQSTQAVDQITQDGKRRVQSSVIPTKSNYSGFGASATIHSCERINQTVENPARIVATDRGTFEIVSSSAWGDVLVPVENSDLHKVTAEELNGIRLIKDFPKIPADLWTRWIDLCFHFCPEDSTSYSDTSHRTYDPITSTWKEYKFGPDGQRYQVDDRKFGFAQGVSSSYSPKLEVTVLLCRKEDDLSQWRMLIPRQSVSGGSVRAEIGPCIDITTGERFEFFPPPGWLHAGSSHSHNTMDAFFSSIDNTSEISVPGVHIVVGRINHRSNTYTQQSSIVLRRLRKDVKFTDIVNPEPIEEATFHSDVLEYITKDSSSQNGWVSGSRSPIPDKAVTSQEVIPGIDINDDDWERQWGKAWGFRSEAHASYYSEGDDKSDDKMSDCVNRNRDIDFDKSEDSAFLSWLKRQNQRKIASKALPTTQELLEDVTEIDITEEDDAAELSQILDVDKIIEHFYNTQLPYCD